MPAYFLSKTRFVAGRQCVLRLWNETHARELGAPPDAATLARFEVGHRVGELARGRHQGGVLVEGGHEDPLGAVARTRFLMADPAVPAIFEAAFLERGVLALVDILARVPDGGWDLIEVKSTSKPKEVHEWDVAAQHWVLSHADVPLRQTGILTLNPDYLYPGGDLDIQGLFALHDRTEASRDRLPAVGEMIAGFESALKSSLPPSVPVGPQCDDPYPCPFIGHCTRHLTFPENPVGNLPRIRRERVEEWKRQGVERIEDLPPSVRLTDAQEVVRQAVHSGKPWVSQGLGPALGQFQYPIHFLDFETVAPAIPRFPSTRPFGRLPVQWSCHQEGEDGGLAHSEFLAGPEDPRRAFAESLLQTLGVDGSICVYSGFEAGVIRELAEALPDLADSLRALPERFVDLLAVIRSHYYHPGFHGSYSIKKVLPALVPHMGYDGLEVGDGSEAMLAFERMVQAGDGAERERLRRALLDYCAQDTLAMVEVRRALVAVANGPPP